MQKLKAAQSEEGCRTASANSGLRLGHFDTNLQRFEIEIVVGIVSGRLRFAGFFQTPRIALRGDIKLLWQLHAHLL
ncbi:MAG: hypothetical protein DMG98_04145 [Acidobacteria bacterium]|nr:MAG: hypothetical protein DMG98_04145 [Acidobacteriota bacterium]